MKKRLFRFTSFRVIVLIMLPVVVVPSALLLTFEQNAHAQHFAETLNPADDTWMTEPWTGDDAPYAAARARISSEIKASKNVAADVTRYRFLCTFSPSSPMAAYSLATAVNAGLGHVESDDQAYDWVSAALAALSNAPSPHVYDYSRIRLLLTTIHCDPNDDVRRLAVRLLAYRESDPDVLSSAGWCFGPTDIKRSIHYFDEAIAIDPESPWQYDRLGRQCVGAYIVTHDPRYGEMAIAAEKKFLSLHPPRKDMRDDAQANITDTENCLKQVSGIIVK